MLREDRTGNLAVPFTVPLHGCSPPCIERGNVSMRVVPSARASWRKFLGCMSLLALGLASAVSPVCAGEGPRRIFLLEGLTASEPSVQRTVEAFTQRLKERSSEDIEVY